MFKQIREEPCRACYVCAWNEINGLGWDHFQKLPGIMADTSSKEIQRVAAKFFGEKKAFIVRVLPK